MKHSQNTKNRIRIFRGAAVLGGIVLLLAVEGRANLNPQTVPAAYHGRIVSARPAHFPERLLALTFDDGPNDRTTPHILDSLKAHHAHATFFVLGGQAKRFPGLIRRILAEGHALGSHSYSHPARVTPEQAKQELNRTEVVLKQITGQMPHLFRPPYGITKNSLTRLATARGYTIVLWTISSADTQPISAKAIAANIIHTPAPGDFALLHDGAGHLATAEAVPSILDELSRSGYRFVTLPELLTAWEKWRIGATSKIKTVPGRH